MFSNMIIRNSKRSRKENGLFFGSLVISIIAFYIILSISDQDVMRFLKEMESDAVNKLLLLIPSFYIVTLGILFFLIYYACKYQLQRRRHEFGIYLMLGMQRSKLFMMLIVEDLVNSALALVIGLPIAVLLSEVISLITAKTVGLGIIGHHVSFSLYAIFFTAIGFFVIKLLAFLLLSGYIARQQIGSLIAPVSATAKKFRSPIFYGLAAACGVAMIAGAYTMAIQGIAWQKSTVMLVTLLLGIFGTVFLFYGMRAVISLILKFRKANQWLRTFNFRQIQENIIQKSTSLAVSSLLILAGLCCFGAGIGVSSVSKSFNTHILDYTFSESNDIILGQETQPDQVFPMVQSILRENKLDHRFSELFQMREGHIHTTEETDGVFVMNSVIDGLKHLPQSEDRDILLNNLGYTEYPNVICLSDYNKLLALTGKPDLHLNANEAAVYCSLRTTNATKNDMLNQILKTHPEVELDGNTMYLTGKVQTLPLVTDSSIVLSFALILPDEQFLYYTQGNYNVYVNGILKEDTSNEAGLMNMYASMNKALDEAGLDVWGLAYESYLQNIGRQLFYAVAASYITSYLAIIFLVVANTMVGVQFLMNQQRTGRRYQTLIRLGATYHTLCVSARKQINWFMGLPVVIAAISSLFGVKALYSGILSSEIKHTQGKIFFISVLVIIMLCIVEWIYMTVVKRSSDRYLLTLMRPQREECERGGLL